MTQRLPIPGKDRGIWGDILNDFLLVSLNPDGTLKTSAINTVGLYSKPSGGIPESDLDQPLQTAINSVVDKYIKPTSGIPQSDLDSPTQTILSSVAGKYTKPSSGIPSSDMTSSVQANLGLASSSVQLGGDLGGTTSSPILAKLQGITVNGSGPANGQVLAYNGSQWVPSTVSSSTVNNATSSTPGIIQLSGDISGTATSPTIVSTHLSSALPVNQGGTGSTSQNFVDLSTNQSIGGNKTLTGSTSTSALSTTSLAVTGGSPASGKVLTSDNSGNATWSTPSAGSLSGDSDVSLSSPANNQVLTYDSSTSKWINQNAPTASNATSSTPGLIQLDGDLSGTATSPSVAKISGISLPLSSPSANQVLTATSSTTTSWSTPAAGVTLDATASDIQPDTTTGSPVAGSVGKAADAGHQHTLAAHDHTTTNKGGNIPIGGLSATGTPSSTTFLRGDNTWSTPPSDANATTSSVGVIQLSGDLGGTATSPTVTSTHLASPLPVNQGGTGSTSQNFVDLSTNQSISGIKTYSGEIIVPTPVNPTDAATKAYVDATAQGLSIKYSVIALASTNQSLSGLPTVDSITLSSGQRILLTGQSSQGQNGIWTVSSGSWSRPSDYASSSTQQGAFVFVEAGTTYGSSGWILTGDSPITVDTTNQTWTQFSGAGQITAGSGLSKSGNTLSLTSPVAIALGGTGAATTSQNFAFMGPTSGSGAPSFRAITSGDLPTLSSYLQVSNNLSELSSSAAAARSNISAAEWLSPVTVQTSSSSPYSANPGDYVPIDTTNGNVVVNLPTTPTDKTRIGVKMVIQGGSNTVTINSAGGDVFNKAGGGTSFTLSLVNQGVLLQYSTTGAIWYVQSDDLALSQLDTRFSYYLNVKNYGVTGDTAANCFAGIAHDDTAAFAAALSAVKTPDSNGNYMTLWIPAGDYYVDMYTAGFSTNTNNLFIETPGMGKVTLWHFDSASAGAQTCIKISITDDNYWAGTGSYITGATAAGGVFTFTTGAANRFSVSQLVTISGCTNGYNLVNATIATVNSGTNTFTVNASTGGVPATGIGGQAILGSTELEPYWKSAALCATSIRGIRIDGTHAPAGSIGIDYGPGVYARFRVDVRNFTGFSASGNPSIGIRLRNRRSTTFGLGGWTEDTIFERNSAVSNNQVGVWWDADNSVNSFQGTTLERLYMVAYSPGQIGMKILNGPTYALASGTCATVSGSTITWTTASPVTMVSGNTVNITGMTTAGFNGFFSVTSNCDNSTSFTTSNPWSASSSDTNAGSASLSTPPQVYQARLNMEWAALVAPQSLGELSSGLTAGTPITSITVNGPASGSFTVYDGMALVINDSTGGSTNQIMIAQGNGNSGVNIGNSGGTVNIQTLVPAESYPANTSTTTVSVVAMGLQVGGQQSDTSMLYYVDLTLTGESNTSQNVGLFVNGLASNATVINGQSSYVKGKGMLALGFGGQAPLNAVNRVSTSGVGNFQFIGAVLAAPITLNGASIGNLPLDSTQGSAAVVGDLRVTTGTINASNYLAISDFSANGTPNVPGVSPPSVSAWITATARTTGDLLFVQNQATTPTSANALHIRMKNTGSNTGKMIQVDNTITTGLFTVDVVGNAYASNFQPGYTTTTTAAGTTTLTNASTNQQFFTGSTTQTVVLPVTSTLSLGWQYTIVNNSTASVTVQSSGANTILVLQGGTRATLTCILTSGTTAASWSSIQPATPSATQTFTNKRNTLRVGSVASSATPTINTDNFDIYEITALATNITSMTTNLSGTPNDGDQLLIRIKDNNSSSFSITWGASFISSGIATLMTATQQGKQHTVGLIWDASKSAWVCLAVDGVGY